MNATYSFKVEIKDEAVPDLLKASEEVVRDLISPKLMITEISNRGLVSMAFSH